MEGIKYFLLNKKDDFVRQKEYLCSNLMDSKEKQNIWSRLHVQCGEMKESAICMQVFISDQRYLIWKGERWDIQHIIANPDILMEEKIMMYSHIGNKKDIEGISDCLLKRHMP